MILFRVTWIVNIWQQDEKKFLFTLYNVIINIHNLNIKETKKCLESNNRYRKMGYECQWDELQFIKVNPYKSRYGLQHEALTHIEQQAIKGPKKLLVYKVLLTSTLFLQYVNLTVW